MARENKNTFSQGRYPKKNILLTLPELIKAILIREWYTLVFMRSSVHVCVSQSLPPPSLSLPCSPCTLDFLDVSVGACVCVCAYACACVCLYSSCILNYSSNLSKVFLTGLVGAIAPGLDVTLEHHVLGLL